MPTPHDPHQNHLLAALPSAEFDRLVPHLQLVQLQLGEILYESGVQMRHACFPTSAVASLHYVTESGSSAETAVVGNEGMVGIPLFMGGDTTASSAMVQTAGHAYLLEARLLREAFGHSGMMHCLLLYTQALMTQMSQAAACNRYHSVEQQLCRSLLCSLDRAPSNELTITQDLIGGSLGVRREGIAEAADRLQQAGFIRYRRAHITVLQRVGLESRTCECYEVVKQELLRLLPQPVSMGIA